MRGIETDVLVVGSGIAGLSFALKVCERYRVTVVTKKERAASNTNWAQGGIASVMGDDDDPALHIQDTLRAGAGLCHTAAVERLAREGPIRVRELMAWGARFTEREGRLSLGREGGHSRRRIVHAADLTGREIERALLEAVSNRPAIEVLEDYLAVDLLIDPNGAGTPTAGGALVLDRGSGETLMVRAPVTFLATGGLGHAYLRTTNPEIATGDGVAMGYRAGATLANLEFVQFHPTALYPADDRATLISEAVRGEGAVLRTRSGHPLMEGVHPLGSLATRDVVARAIYGELITNGEAYVLLDLSPIEPSVIERRFPYILSACAERGLDIRTSPIPVVPAAHYACGGIQTDARARTGIAGLLAAGEVACTGVHGANRLASNSLLEAVVYSHRAAEQAVAWLAADRRAVMSPSASVCNAPWPGAERITEEDRARWRGILAEVRALMWESAGIVRSDAGLEGAERRLRALKGTVDADYGRVRLDAAAAELRNLVDTALLIVVSARRRKESRGLHFNEDHPHRDNERFLRDTIVRRGMTDDGRANP